MIVKVSDNNNYRKDTMYEVYSPTGFGCHTKCGVAIKAADKPLPLTHDKQTK